MQKLYKVIRSRPTEHKRTEQCRNDVSRVDTQDPLFQVVSHGTTVEPTAGDQKATYNEKSIDGDPSETIGVAARKKNKTMVHDY